MTGRATQPDIAETAGVAPYVATFVGVVAASFAAIFIRYAQADEMPSLVIAAYRLGLAALILTPITWARHRAELLAISRRDLAMAALAGMFLALHFATWIASLEHTTVLIGVVLVNTSPLITAMLSAAVLKERIRRLTVIGLALALAGMLLIAVGGAASEDGTARTLGAVLALVGAVAVAVYLLIGRGLRARVPLLPYIWLVYGTAALALIAAAVLAGHSLTGHTPASYIWCLLLALGPQILGHSSFNYALAHLSATFISTATLAEPVLSSLLALVLFAEIPTGAQILGSAAVLAGIFLATRAERKRKDAHT